MTFGTGGQAIGCPTIRPGLVPLDTAFVSEVWAGTAPVAYDMRDGFATAVTPALLAGAITLPARETAPLETLAFDLYCRLFDLIDAAGYPHLLRMFNYLPALTDTPDGFERYQRFSVGRHDAFAARKRGVAGAPAASALGSRGGPISLAFLAARLPGQALENPRQVSAYAYPERYGPRSPTFSRALLGGPDGTSQFFLSGTASIVGHESHHPGDAPAQTRETLANIAAMRREAVNAGLPPDHAMLYKVYARSRMVADAARPIIDAALGPRDRAVYLEADICRSDLLLEIDGASIP